ncbi:hypothetical protein PGT21_022111, partial [Puccinia graminis f. sp. tritici]
FPKFESSERLAPKTQTSLPSKDPRRRYYHLHIRTHVASGRAFALDPQHGE